MYPTFYLLNPLHHSLLRRLGVSCSEDGLVATRHSHKPCGVQVAGDGVAVDLVMLLNLEAVEKPHVQEIELSVRVEYVVKRKLLEAARKEGFCHSNSVTYRHRLTTQ